MALAAGSPQRRRRMLPTTRFGWVSVAAAAGTPIFYLVARAAGALGLETTGFAPAIVIPLLLAVLSAFVALVAAVAALLWRDWTATVVGGIVTSMSCGAP